MVRQVGLTKAHCVMPVERHTGRQLTLSISFLQIFFGLHQSILNCMNV